MIAMIDRQRVAPCWLLGAVMICSLVLPCELWAQQDAQTPAPASPSGPAQTGQKTESNKDKNTDATEPAKPQNDRIFWALPNFLTVENASSAPKLTVGQKFKLVAQSTFDPVEFGFIALASGINQASNSEPSYGQGFVGYAKRYGTTFGDTNIGNFMTGAVFPSLLHQDPRYYQLGKGGVLHRALYAGCRVFVTRSDTGNNQFNFSEILGNGVAAGIANGYHPPPRTLLNSISIWWTSIGWDAAGYELKEFWPDIKHKLHP
jgi:hypothetical protein